MTAHVVPAHRAKKVRAPETTWGCAGCTNRWTGTSRSHCSGCHRTYSSVSAFDGHRRAAAKAGSGVCLSTQWLVSAGYRLTPDRRGGVWYGPGTFPEELKRGAR